MNAFVGILKSMIPVALGVTVGMITYEQVKKLMVK
jgi:hypothetical protein